MVHLDGDRGERKEEEHMGKYQSSGSVWWRVQQCFILLPIMMRVYSLLNYEIYHEQYIHLPVLSPFFRSSRNFFLNVFFILYMVLCPTHL